MTHIVSISEQALDDLFNLHRWVAEQAGVAVADAYQDRIDARLRSLREFPERGTPREDLGQGIRSIPFERRIVILYRVSGNIVSVLRIPGGAQNLGTLSFQ